MTLLVSYMSESRIETDAEALLREIVAVGRQANYLAYNGDTRPLAND
ncbi:hypothetical protein [Candidatus Raskinella chloraquaticus]